MIERAARVLETGLRDKTARIGVSRDGELGLYLASDPDLLDALVQEFGGKVRFDHHSSQVEAWWELAPAHRFLTAALPHIQSRGVSVRIRGYLGDAQADEVAQEAGGEIGSLDALPLHDPVVRRQATSSSRQEQVQAVLSQLTPRQQQVLKLRFGLDDGRRRTLEEVGQALGLSKQYVSKIAAQALAAGRMVDITRNETNSQG